MLALSLQFHTADLMKLITHLIADVFLIPGGLTSCILMVSTQS